MLYRRLRAALKRQDWLAYLIELVIVVLGITIAYQLNVYQQNSSEQKMKAALLENLRVENEQNYEEYKDYEGQFSKRPLQLYDVVKLFDNYEISNLQQNDTLTHLLNIVERTVYYSIRDSYLNTYLSNIAEMKNNDLTRELLRLQSFYEDLNYLWRNVNEYKLEKIYDFTAIAYDRKTNTYSIETLKDNIFLNRVNTLASIESEHARMFRESLKQMEIVDSLLSLE